jgi:hypothetical protein
MKEFSQLKSSDPGQTSKIYFREYIIGLNASFQEFMQISLKGADAITN